jgi:hypothetical protein
MCTGDDRCTAWLEHTEARNLSFASPVTGLAIAQQALVRATALPGWDEKSFISADWSVHTVHLLVQGEKAGQEIAALLLPNSSCVDSYVSDGRHWKAWRGTYAGTALRISTSWPATPPATPSRAPERRPSLTETVQPHRPRRA